MLLALVLMCLYHLRWARVNDANDAYSYLYNYLQFPRSAGYTKASFGWDTKREFMIDGSTIFLSSSMLPISINLACSCWFSAKSMVWLAIMQFSECRSFAYFSLVLFCLLSSLWRLNSLVWRSGLFLLLLLERICSYDGQCSKRT